MMVAVALAFSAAADAQVYVKIRPPMPRVVATPRPPAPSRHHVWISGEWQVNNGRYERKEGYWAEPDNNRHYLPNIMPKHYNKTLKPLP